MLGSMSMGPKEDESSNGHIWAAGFHHVMAWFCLVHILKLHSFSILSDDRSKAPSKMVPPPSAI
jgi:hypothetical protein